MLLPNQKSRLLATSLLSPSLPQNGGLRLSLWIRNHCALEFIRRVVTLHHRNRRFFTRKVDVTMLLPTAFTNWRPLARSQLRKGFVGLPRVIPRRPLCALPERQNSYLLTARPPGTSGNNG